MQPDPIQFINATVEQVAPLEKAYALAEWESAISGTPKASRRTQEAQAAMLRFWASPDRHALAKRFDAQSRSYDPVTARQIHLILLESAKAQQDEQTIQSLTELEARVRDLYYNFRGKLDGAELSDNELDAILADSHDPVQVKAAWEASKQVGHEVAGFIRELARVRNAAARAQGFRDHFEKALKLDEVDEDMLTRIFKELQAAGEGPYTELKAEIDRQRASLFGIRLEDLRPWHYGDPFFQRVPKTGIIDLDAIYAGKDPTALAKATYDGLGMDVREILARSDLYPRPGKNQHAFCIDIDRQGDVRTLNNLVQNLRWNGTLHHELGHAVYYMYVDPELPWLLRAPSHTLTTEGIAQLMGRLVQDREWLIQIAEVPASEAEVIARAAAEHVRAENLIFIRWCMVMTYFERAMYANPDADLDNLWWELVERYQHIRRPDGRQAPDWAAKYHLALAPVYYHNYALGLLVTAQFEAHLRRATGGFVGRVAAGDWLKEQVFRPGARQIWTEHLAAATGEPVNPNYFVEASTGTPASG
ncbi:MAG TPA: M2 family metallopeptidase [Anaerolineales bacterium]|nr:M2 family metallopeptidase [Anaerolineales bacterium]